MSSTFNSDERRLKNVKKKTKFEGKEMLNATNQHGEFQYMAFKLCGGRLRKLAPKMII